MSGSATPTRPRSPGGDIRNLTFRDEFSGCSEERNSGYSDEDEVNDWECDTYLEGWYCTSDEDTHCEADYDTLFNFQHLEKVVQLVCAVDPVLSEYKYSTPEVDEDCPQPQAGQRREEVARYIIRVVTPNPERKDDPDAAPFLSATFEISRQAWAHAEREPP